MKLHIDFDDELIRRYCLRGSEPNFLIYWEHEGQYYPDDVWYDFGGTIIQWWEIDLEKYHNKEIDKMEFLFMDGPCEMHLYSCGNKKLKVELLGDDNLVWVVDHKVVISEIAKGVDKIIKKYNELSIINKGLAITKKDIMKLIKLYS